MLLGAVKMELPKFRQPKFKPPFGGKTFQEKGKDFELRVRRDLRQKGYEVLDAENRHYDWLAHKGGKTYAVECKENMSSFSYDEIKFAITTTKKGKLIYLIAIKNFNGRIKYWHA